MSPFFITVPHSGEEIPKIVSWLSSHEETILMADVDRYVDLFYEQISVDKQIPFVKTNWHRYVVDLNRSPTDVDQDSVIGSSKQSGSHSDGFHWVKTKQGKQLMSEPITQSLHEELIQLCFEPFHNQVRALYKKLLSNNNKVYQLDGHSMPSLGTQFHRDPGEQRAEIVISDQDGASCDSNFTDLVVGSYERAGFEVKKNWPYKGGGITQTYGKPELGQHCIQVELNRDLYMNESTKKLTELKFRETKNKIVAAVSEIHKGINSL